MQAAINVTFQARPIEFISAQGPDFGVYRSTLELRLCFVDLRFFVALGKSYIKSVGLHVSALNRDHTFFVSSNWAEGKDLYEMEERRVIAREGHNSTDKVNFYVDHLLCVSMRDMFTCFKSAKMKHRYRAWHCSTAKSDLMKANSDKYPA